MPRSLGKLFSAIGDLGSSRFGCLSADLDPDHALERQQCGARQRSALNLNDSGRPSAAGCAGQLPGISSRRVSVGIDRTESVREWTSRLGHPQLATPGDEALRAGLGAGVFALAAVPHGQTQPTAAKASSRPGPDGAGTSTNSGTPSAPRRYTPSSTKQRARWRTGTGGMAWSTRCAAVYATCQAPAAPLLPQPRGRSGVARRR